MSREGQRISQLPNPRIAYKEQLSNGPLPANGSMPQSRSSSIQSVNNHPCSHFYFTTPANGQTFNHDAPVQSSISVSTNLLTQAKLPTRSYTDELKPDGDMSIKLNENSISPTRFAMYIIGLAKNPSSGYAYQFIPLRRTEAETLAINNLNLIISLNVNFGIYSDSPFLRPVHLLRRVQFATPANVLYQYPDPDNMIRTLRDLADQKVASIPLLAILSGSKPIAASLGFCTDYLTHTFNLQLDADTMRHLSEQSANQSSPAVQYRVILRLSWATTGLYMPPNSSNRVLAREVLPRCLAIRVARRNVILPDPIFHSGQAQKLGHRLRLSIDITDRIPIRPNSQGRSPVLNRDRNIEIDLTWLHAPLEDHALPLLDLVGCGTCTPIVNHLLNLPLVQVTLDRLQPIPLLVKMFSSALPSKPDVDFQPNSKPWFMNNQNPESLRGVYDFCHSNDRVILASTTLEMIKSKLGYHDELQCDDWLPVSLSCPLTLTRIEVPVRSVNCDHLQCYDLKSYLTINKRRPRWSCPVCSSSAPFRDLRRDDFFVQLLSDKALKEVDLIHVDSTGKWKNAVKSSGFEVDNPTSQKINENQLPNLNNNSTSESLMPLLKKENIAPLSVKTPDIILLDDEDDDEDNNDNEVGKKADEMTKPNDTIVKIQLTPINVKPRAAEITQTRANNSSQSQPMFVDLTTSSDEECLETTAAAIAVSQPPSLSQVNQIFCSPFSANSILPIQPVLPPTNLAQTQLANALELNYNLIASLSSPPLALSTNSQQSLPLITGNNSKSNYAVPEQPSSFKELLIVPSSNSSNSTQLSDAARTIPGRFKITTKRRDSTPPPVQPSPQPETSFSLASSTMEMSSNQTVDQLEPDTDTNPKRTKAGYKRHFVYTDSSSSTSSSSLSSSSSVGDDDLWEPSKPRRIAPTPRRSSLRRSTK